MNRLKDWKEFLFYANKKQRNLSSSSSITQNAVDVKTQTVIKDKDGHCIKIK